MTTLAIQARSVGKSFARGPKMTVALKDLTLDVAEGEFVALLGRSGCGKSTLLNLIAGLDGPSSGSIETGGRRIGMMFQDANLFPWLTVKGNIELALRLAGVPQRDFPRRVADLLALVRLPEAADLRPHQLSGGMRQRVALARTLAQECQVLLMDEPFGALDAITRDAMHDETERIWAQQHLTVIFVTHNVREAARLGSRVIVLAPQPGTIDAEEMIDIPRPRRIDSPEVSAMAALLRSHLQGGL